MMALAPIDHIDRLLPRLLEQFKGSPRLIAVLSGILDEANELEGVLFDLIEDRLLDTAVGEQLDVLGRVLDRRRGALTDEPYRTALRAELALLRSSGQIDDIHRIFEILSPSLVVTSEPHYPAKFQYNWLSPPLDDFTSSTYIVLIKRARAAGVGVYFYWLPVAASSVFAFSATTAGTGGTAWGDDVWGDTGWGGGASMDGGEIDSAQGFSDTSQTTGGQLAGIAFV